MQNLILNRRSTLARLGGFGVLALSTTLLAACNGTQKPAQFHSVDITGIDYARNFHLTDFDGKARTLADFKGDVVVVFFGYTNCPDVCPTTMSDLVQVKQKLGAAGDRLKVLFISLDPERDTPEVLKEYLGAFDPGFLALYATSPEQLAQTAKDFKVFYQRVDGATPGNYSVDHTAASYVYDPQGRLRLFARFGLPADELASDVKLLLGGA